MTELPDLDRLIAAVAESAATDDPLARLAAAAKARDELDDLTESLLDHFIEQARQAGCSWTQIGNVLGISKQAAQQRHTAIESVARQLFTRLSGRGRPGRGLFTRFTPGARASVVSAQGAARRLRHSTIRPEHVLLGLLGDHDGLAATALAEFGVTEETVEAAIIDQTGSGAEDVRGHIPFTPQSKKILELALREAIRLGHHHIGTEHILLGLLRAGDGAAAEILAQQGADADRAREVIMRLAGEAE